MALASSRVAFLTVGVGAALTTVGFARIPLGSGRPVDEESGEASISGSSSDFATGVAPSEPLDEPLAH